jgi:hypothetical protein
MRYGFTFDYEYSWYPKFAARSLTQSLSQTLSRDKKPQFNKRLLKEPVSDGHLKSHNRLAKTVGIETISKSSTYDELGIEKYSRYGKTEGYKKVSIDTQLPEKETIQHRDSSEGDLTQRKRKSGVRSTLATIRPLSPGVMIREDSE